MREQRQALGVRPVYKRVATCAAVFVFCFAFLFLFFVFVCLLVSCVCVLFFVFGGGFFCFGLGFVFVFCCVHAALVLREVGFVFFLVFCFLVFFFSVVLRARLDAVSVGEDAACCAAKT